MKTSYLVKNKKNNVYKVVESYENYYGVKLLCIQNGYELENAYPKQYIYVWCDFRNGVIDREELNLQLELNDF